MNRAKIEEIATAVGDLLKKQEEVKEEKKCKAVLWVFAIIGAVAAAVAIAYAIYCYFTPGDERTVSVEIVNQNRHNAWFYISEKPWDELEIRVYPGADGTFTLYEDEGDNYNYEKGKFSEIQFVWNEAGRTLSIAPRKGSYKGMLQHRRFHIVLVGADSGAGDQAMQASKSVEYEGKAVKVQL